MLNPRVLLFVAVVAAAAAPARVSGARILCAAPFFGTSHSIFIQSVMKQLANSGHDVTIITFNLAKDPPPNYKEIKVDEFVFPDKIRDHFAIKHQSALQILWTVYTTTEYLHETVFNSIPVAEFIEKDNSHFDLVISELFYQEVLAMFAHKYKAPLVLLGTSKMPWHIGELMGNPLLPSFLPHDVFRGVEEFGILDRICNTFVTAVDILARKFYFLPMQNRLASKYFGKTMNPLPAVEDVYYNASLVLLNTHFSISQTLPLVPGIVEIGGAHILPPTKLPDNIKKFLDEAKDGVIYFSLGTHLLSSEMDKNVTNAFLKVFAKLKQRVVWKWEDDDPPQQQNVLTGKWLPQNDILAHPNVKVFINHGGMLSLQEALDKGVPILGIPIFADQPVNIAHLKSRGVAEALDYRTICEATIREALDKLLSDPSYQKNAKIVSKLFRDRQNSPLDTAAYWVEYVLRHGGVPALKSPLAHLAWYKYYLLDVMLLLAVTMLIVTYCAIKMLCMLLNMFKKKTNNVKASKKVKKK